MHNTSFDVEAMIDAIRRGEGKEVYRVTLPFATDGLADAQVTMGALYQLGIAVPPDSLQALFWYRKAAEQNHPLAWNNLGTLFVTGLPGVEPDNEEAERCYKRARELGFQSD